MAIHAHTPGAPTCATVILAFPMPPMRQFRMELARCHNSKMIDRWLKRVQRTNSGLTRFEYEELALRGFTRSRILAAEGR